MDPPPIDSVLEGERLLQLVAAIQEGFPLVSRPFAVIAQGLGWREEEVLDGLRTMLATGMVHRLGVIVRHHELGYRANAMVVWDVPDSQAPGVGRELLRFDFVTLCYRRHRHLPEWPYNLYCMIHGRQREQVLNQIEVLTAACGLDAFPRQILFSKRRFKQRGAIYLP